MADKNFKVKNALELGNASIVTPGGTLSLPSATDTVVGRATADTLTNKIFTSPEETVTISATAATGTINFDVVSQAILYYSSNASANWTLNIRGNSGTTLDSLLGVGNSITVTFLVTNGATPYYQTALQIDGNAVTPKWAGGSAPTSGNASSIDAYYITIIKTAATPTYLVLATQVGLA